MKKFILVIPDLAPTEAIRIVQEVLCCKETNRSRSEPVKEGLDICEDCRKYDLCNTTADEVETVRMNYYGTDDDIVPIAKKFIDESGLDISYGWR